MKRTTKLFAILLVFAVAFSCLCTMGATADEEGVFTYYIADNSAVLTDVKNTAAGEVTVPDTLGGMPVRMIDGAFRNKTRITSVVLPDSVTVIAQNSFAYCSALKTVDFGNGLISVASNAFPAAFRRIVHEQNKSLQDKYAEFIRLLFVEGNPAGIKTVMHQMGLIQNCLRLPLVPNSLEVQTALQDCLTRLSDNNLTE